MFDSALQLLLRTGIQRSKKAPSALHPYGYMKDKFVWSLISAVGIFCLGAGVTVVHGFHGLFVQTQLEHLTAGLTGQQCKQNESQCCNGCCWWCSQHCCSLHALLMEIVQLAFVCDKAVYMCMTKDSCHKVLSL